jgi:hypothetical protein
MVLVMCSLISRSCSCVTISKAQVFVVPVELSWLFLEHAHKVFHEMPVRGKVLSRFHL